MLTPLGRCLTPAFLPRAFGFLTLIFYVLIGSALPASATTYTWNGGGGSVLWSIGGNWTGGVPTSATTTDLIFAGTTNLGSLGTPLLQDIGSPMTLNSMTFNAGSGAFYLGGSALKFNGSGNTITQSSSNTVNIANDISNPNNKPTTLTLAGNGTGLITLSGVISPANGGRDYSLVKSGTSTYALTGANTYGGDTTINGGTLIINSASSLGTGSLTLNAGTLEVSNTFTTTRTITLGDAASTIMVDPSQTYTINSAIGGTGTLNKTGTGTLVLGGSNTFSGGTDVSAGTLQISASDRLANAGAITVSGGTFDLQTFNETAGAVSLTSGSITGTGSATLTGSSYAVQSGTISAILAGTGVLTKTTAGTVTLSGANTYSGGTAVNAGTLALASSGAIGSSGTIAFGGGTLQHSSSNTTDYSSRFSNAASQSYNVDTNGQNVTWATALTSSGGTMAKYGSGTLTLTGANTFTGATTVNAGTLALAKVSGSALGSTSSITVNSGGTLLLGGSNQINNSAGMTLAGGTFSKGNFSEGTAGAVGIGALTLSAAGSHIDFGTGTVGILDFASFSAASNTLTIDNWTGTAQTVGSALTDRLIFDSDQTTNLAFFSFSGYAGAMEIALGGGFFEIVPMTAVPEPSTYAVGFLAVVAVLRHAPRRRR